MRSTTEPTTIQRPTLHVCRTQDVDWVRWAMPGAQFKLLHADPTSGRFSLMIRMAAGVAAPAHRHLGAVEGYILEGGFHYLDNPEIRFEAGCYMLEDDGAVHQPASLDGALMFAVFHGPVEGLDADGNITGRIGCQWHIDTWRAAGHAFPHA